jgi:hypothetical protein
LQKFNNGEKRVTAQESDQLCTVWSPVSTNALNNLIVVNYPPSEFVRVLVPPLSVNESVERNPPDKPVHLLFVEFQTRCFDRRLSHFVVEENGQRNTNGTCKPERIEIISCQALLF